MLHVGEAGLDLQVQRRRTRLAHRLEVEQAVGAGIDPVDEQARHRAGLDRCHPLHDLRLHLGRRQAERVDRLERDERAPARDRHVTALAGVGVEHDDALGRLGVVGEGERVGRPRVPDALGDLDVEVVVAEEHEVGAQQRVVDLDLVDVGVRGLDRLDAGMGEEQVGAVEAAGAVGLVERVDRRLDGEHLRHRVDDEPG